MAYRASARRGWSYFFCVAMPHWSYASTSLPREDTWPVSLATEIDLGVKKLKKKKNLHFGFDAGGDQRERGWASGARGEGRSGKRDG